MFTYCTFVVPLVAGVRAVANHRKKGAAPVDRDLPSAQRKRGPPMSRKKISTTIYVTPEQNDRVLESLK